MKKQYKKPILIAMFTFFVLVAPMLVFSAAEEDDKVVFKVGFWKYEDWGTWDPAAGGPVMGWPVMENVIEFLYRYNIFTKEWEGVLAKSWEQINRTAWKINLREEVLFHDGTPFNAEAAIWNIERLYTINRKPGADLYSAYMLPAKPLRPYDALADDWDVSWVPEGGLLTYFNRTEYDSEYSFILHTNIPAGTPFGYNYAMYSPTHYFPFAAETWDDDRQSCVATGPFKYLGFDAPNGIFHLERFDDYWNGTAYIEEVFFQGSADADTSQLSLLAGEIDACLFPQDPDQFENEAGIEVIEYPGDMGVGGVELVLIMPLHYVNFTIRKALAYSYNYTQHIENIYNGYAIAAGGIIPTNNLYYNSSVPKPYQNITISRQTLMDDPGTAARIADHGLTLDSSDEEWVSAANGPNPIASFTYWYQPSGENMGQIFVPNAAKAGIFIKTEIQTPELLYDYWVDGFYGGYRKDIPLSLMYPHLGDGPDPREGIHGAYESSNFYNWAGVNDSEIDTMIWDSWYLGYNETTSPTMQEHLDALVYKVQNEIIPMIWITQTTRKTAISTDWEVVGEDYMGVQNGMRTNIAYLLNVKPKGGVPTTQVIPGISLEALGVVSAMAIVGAIYVIKRKSTVF